MDYNKIDAALANALSSGEPAEQNAGLEVFVRTSNSLDAMQQRELEALGVRGVRPNRTVFTARVPREVVERLSESPWVRLISLAQTLRPSTKR